MMKAFPRQIEIENTFVYTGDLNHDKIHRDQGENLKSFPFTDD